MVLVGSCVTCVMCGFCGILAYRRFTFAWCVVCSGGVARRGRGLWKRDVPGRAVTGVGNRGFGVRGNAEAGSLAAPRTTCRAAVGR
jgi:hypothetical protein